jgi:carbon storage regulator
MLVLSRQRDESIVIAEEITVTIVDIRGDKVRLGIKAPADVPVHRREVFEAIRFGEPGCPAAATLADAPQGVRLELVRKLVGGPS